MKLIDYTNPNSFASKMRRKRMLSLSHQIGEIIEDKPATEKDITICDIGGTATYWGLFPFDSFPGLTFNITLFNLDYQADSGSTELPSNVQIEKHVGDACNLSAVDDRSYDLCHSNSVIEHVGNWSKIVAMANEITRISRYHYMQTPNFWFPVEPHFLIPFYAGLPRPARVRLQELLRNRGFPEDAMTADESVRLLTKRELSCLFPDSEIQRERFFLFTKSFIVTGNS